MKLNENGPFYDFGLVQAIPANIKIQHIEIFHIARHLTGEGPEAQIFRAMDKETNSVNVLIFQSVN